ncbi:MAG: xanthine dehydrogenase family protein, partial [Pirellulales bacterium]|nr:xanthine dehydrogenase family protein [Pirellulales bacterium]
PQIPVRLNATPELEPYHQPVIAHDKVRYVGEPLAVVIADSAAGAEDALGAVTVEIEDIAAVSNLGLSDLESTPPSEPDSLLFDNKTDNRALTSRITKGDAAAAFARATYRHKESFYVHRHTGVMMETRGVLAEWDNANSRLIVSGATKVPFANRRILASLINMPEEAIDFIEGDTGGSFGLRGEFFPEDFLIPFAARSLKRPVKWIEDRREHFLAISHARDARCDIEIACDGHGTILGVSGDIYADVGAYVRTAGTVAPRNAGLFFGGPYRIPNIDISSHAELSNKAPSGTYRAPGRYEADFFRERLFDIVAREMGIDRVEFRRRNLVSEAEMPYSIPSITPASHSNELDSGAYHHILDSCLEKFGWKDREKLQGQQIDGRYHGIAVGCFVEGGAAGPSENAKIELRKDGKFAVYVGSSAVGQGVATVLTQIAADELGVEMERIELFHGSTTLVAEGWGSYASRSTVMGGSAILLCAESIKRMLKSEAAKILQASPETMRIVDSGIQGSDGRTLAWEVLATLDISVEKKFLNNKHTFNYGTHAAHVAVDIKLGSIEVVDYVAVEDPGVVINPLTIHGQVIGAIVQGLGGTLLEHLVYDDDGQLLTGSFADYLLPLATDFSNIRAYCEPLRRSPNNPMGMKGAGEGGIIPVGGVIANAVANALQSLGVEPRSLPLSPSKLWSLACDVAPANVARSFHQT